jgi:hypothetical protein
MNDTCTHKDGWIMEWVSLLVGFAIGVVVLGIVLEIGMKKTSQVHPSSRYANTWSINEIANPKIMAEYLGDVDLPENSKVLVNRYKDKTKLQGMDVREHGEIKGNFIVGEDRALILAGPVKNNEVGFWTVEKEIVHLLNDQFNRYWAEGSRMSLEES